MNLKYKIRLWISNAVNKVTLPIIFYRTHLEKDEEGMLGHFWVRVAWCRVCEQPLNMAAVPGIDEEEVRSCLLFHVWRAHGGFQKLQAVHGSLSGDVSLQSPQFPEAATQPPSFRIRQ